MNDILHAAPTIGVEPRSELITNTYYLPHFGDACRNLRFERATTTPLSIHILLSIYGLELWRGQLQPDQMELTCPIFSTDHAFPVFVMQNLFITTSEPVWLHVEWLFAMHSIKMLDIVRNWPLVTQLDSNRWLVSLWTYEVINIMTTDELKHWVGSGPNPFNSSDPPCIELQHVLQQRAQGHRAWEIYSKISSSESCKPAGADSS